MLREAAGGGVMRSSIRAAAAAALAALFASAAPAGAAAAERMAVFDAELNDSSGEGVREDQQRRLVLITAELRRAIAGSGRYEVVDIAPLQQRLASGPSFRSCAACASEAAAEVGADVALVPVVNKISNLILSITLAELEVGPRGGTRRAVHSAEIRGNTDESWLRGVRWLLRNRLLAEPAR
jgi:hypothetical protein